MKNVHLAVYLVLVLLTTVKGQELPTKSEIISKMQLVNDYWISTHPDPGHRGWDRAVYFTGNQDFYKVYPHHQYLDYAYRWAEKHNWDIDAGTRSTNADQQCAGQVYVDLYRLDPEDDKIADIKGSFDNMINRDNTTAWWWIDALYMAMPSFTKLGVTLGEDVYFDHMYKLYFNTKVDRGLYNEEVGLWYRDESFKPPYTTPNGKDSYWARGNGWVYGAHVKVLQELPQSHKNRDEYEKTFINMSEALKLRQRTDGFWNVSLDDPDDFGGPETSGTAFFTYGMTWGINNGLLDSASYAPVVLKAWNALITTAVHEDGFLGYVQGVGVGPSSAQPVTYENTTDFGVGAFLLAGSELVKMAKGLIPETPKFWVTNLTVIDNTHLKIEFNLPVDQQLLSSADFQIDPFINVQSALPGSNQNTVILTVDPVTRGKYQLTIKGSIKSSEGYELESDDYKYFIYNEIVISDYSGYESGSTNVPENTLDFDLNTRWSSSGDGEYIVYDLGQNRNIKSVSIAFYNGNVRNTYFDLSASPDGTDFEQIFSGQSSGNTLDSELFDFEDLEARYIKYTGYGNSQSNWNSITEFDIEHTNLILDDASLKDISIDGATIEGFQPDKLNYHIELPPGTKDVPDVAAIPSVGSSEIEIVQIDSLPGTIKIIVRAADQLTVLIYELSLAVQLSDDDSLSDLVVNGASIEDFLPQKLDYEIVLDTNLIPVVRGIPSYPEAIVEISQISELPGVCYVKVIAENGINSKTYSIGFSSTVINSKEENIELNFFPNPVKDRIIFANPLENFEIIILNLQGKELLKERINKDSNSINVSSLTRGLYIMKITDINIGEACWRFIKD